MLFFIDGLQWPRDRAAIARSFTARDPAALVAAAPAAGAVRVVARLDLRRMLEAFAAAGFEAVPEFRRTACTPLAGP